MSFFVKYDIVWEYDHNSVILEYDELYLVFGPKAIDWVDFSSMQVQR